MPRFSVGDDLGPNKSLRPWRRGLRIDCVWLDRRQLLPWDYFRLARHPSRILEQLTKTDFCPRRAQLSYGPAPPSSNRALLRLLFSFVLIVTARPHRVSRYIIRDSSTQGIPPGATASEVNAAKDTRIGDFGDRLGKARIGTRAWTYLGGEAECGVLSKCGSQDERGGSTVRGVRRRILGMRRSTGQRV